MFLIPLLLILLVQVTSLNAGQHHRYWYDPLNWGFGWNLCSMDRLSRKSVEPTYEPSDAPTPKITFTEKELRARLNDDEYWVTQQQGMWSTSYESCVPTTPLTSRLLKQATYQ